MIAMKNTELKFPVVAHHRMIIIAAERDELGMRTAFDGFEVVEPVKEERASAGGKYLSYSVCVRLNDRAEMERLDQAFARVPGLKMCL